MRALSVVQLLPALEAGGVERSTLEIAAALRMRGHRSLVISAGGRLLPELQALGSEHIAMDIGRKSLRALRLITPLREQLQRIAPDIVHVRSRLPAWLLEFALRGYSGKRPHRVSTVHGLNSPGRYSRIMTRAERVICVSQTVRDHVLHYYPRTDPARLQVIERGIDPAQYPRGFRPSAQWLHDFAQAYPQLHGGRLLLLPARGTRLKGHHDAIALLGALRDVGADVRLMLVGAQQPGREAYVAELRTLAERLGVAGHLAITAQRDDLRELYAVSALVLQLSNKPESFGRTVLEALSIGCPVLGWAHGGVGELLHHLYPVGAVQLGDATALLRSAMQLLDLQPPVPEHIPFTLAAMQAATIDVYEQLAA